VNFKAPAGARLKTTARPSGDQSGMYPYRSFCLSVSGMALPPAAGAAQIRVRRGRPLLEKKAIHSPSGDHAGA
jgi:hypothetical protein